MALHYPDAPRRRRTGSSVDGVARGLGWFSLALGAGQLLAPRRFGRALGTEARTGFVRACGAREVAAGLGLLLARDAKPWLWARVAGDFVDLAALARCMSPDNPRRTQAKLAMGSVAAVMLVDLLSARRLDAVSGGSYVAPDYSGRSGFPRPPEEMRGLAAQVPGAAAERPVVAEEAAM